MRCIFNWSVVTVRVVPISFPSVPKGDLTAASAGTAIGNSSRLPEMYAEQLASIPQLSGLGPIFKSSKPVELSEEDTEYVVRCVKHTFAKHLVLQVSAFTVLRCAA